MVEEQEKTLEVAFSRCKVAEENLGKRIQDVAHNANNFLSKARATDLKTLKVKGMTLLMVDARRVLHKYAMLNSVTEKIIEI